KDQGKEADATGMAMAAFGERAGPAFAALLLRGGKELRRMAKDLRDADVDNFAQKIADIQLDTMHGQLKILISLFEGVKLSLKSSLLPATRKVIESMQGFATSIGGVVTGMKPLIYMVGDGLASGID